MKVVQEGIGDDGVRETGKPVGRRLIRQDQGFSGSHSLISRIAMEPSLSLKVCEGLGSSELPMRGTDPCVKADRSAWRSSAMPHQSAAKFDESTPDRLLATCWTSAGSVAPNAPDLRSPVNLLSRIKLVSSTGYRGFGVHMVDLREAIRSYGVSGVRSMLDQHGITDVEIEGIADWWTSEPGDNDDVRFVLDVSGAIGASHVKLNPDHLNRSWDLGLWAERFAQLAAMADDVHVRLGLEFLPWTNVPDLPSAVRFIERAAHPNGGLVVDIWHMERSGSRMADLLELPVGYVAGVELNDADREVVGDLYSDTIDRRRYCGEGAFALGSFIRTLRAIGWSGPWGVEILSIEHRRAPVGAALEKAYLSARRQLATEEDSCMVSHAGTQRQKPIG
jgi:sugar phosphate isomerase/epimerase